MKSATLKLLPVGYSVYHAIAELNHSFEQTIENLERLATFGFFRTNCLQAHQQMIEEIRALTNEQLTETLNGREFQNSAHYERLRLRWQKRVEDPEDVPDVEQSNQRSRKRRRPPAKRGRTGKRKMVQK